MSLGEIHHMPSVVPCPECSTVITVNAQKTEDYLLGKQLTCESCNTSLDWWKVLSTFVKTNHMFTMALSIIGAQSSTFTIVLEPETVFTLRFQDFGVPENAKILSINYTPYNCGDSGLFPVELHSNQPRRSRTIIKNEIFLFPKPIKNKLPADSTNVQVWAQWIIPSDNISWENLVASFECYIDGDFNSAIIPANVAVEAEISPLVAKVLSHSASNGAVKSFLENDATYGHQINILLPFICSAYKLCKLPDKIRGLLNRLRKLRNDLAHDGYVTPSLTQDDTGELLTAAVIAVQYCHLLQRQINATPPLA